MLRKLATVVMGLGTLGFLNAASAQDYYQPEERPQKTFVQRLGDVGRSILGVEEERPAPPRPSQRTMQPRAGATRPTPTPRPATVEAPQDPPAQRTAAGTGQVSSPRAAVQPRASESPRAANRMSPSLDERVAAPATPAAKEEVPGSEAGATVGTDVAAARDSGTPGASAAAAPLHERLKRFRGSAFADAAPSTSNTASEPPASSPEATVTTPSASPPSESPKTAPAAQVAESTRPTPALGPTPGAAQASPRAAEPRAAEPRSVASRPSPAAASRTPKFESAAGFDSDPVSRAGKAAEAPPKWASNPTVKTERKADPDVLFARKGPILSVETQGPRKITVGKEAAYEIVLLNSGEVAADEVTVFVNLPDWTEVAGADPSTGGTRPAPQGATDPFQWTLGRIEAKARERLVLRIVPKQSRPFDLSVRWDYKPALSQATIEVQEPKLAMRLEGPREAFFGKRELYKLKVSNTGTGPAENVSLNLTAMGTGDNQPVAHRLGTLPAGEERTIEVELTARQAGNLAIQVEVKADGQVRAELAEKVFVRRAALEVELEGPKVQYVNTPANYRLRVRNPGNAPARKVLLAVALPNGVKFVSGSEGAAQAANNANVHWSLDSLEAGGERTFAMKCNLGVSGVTKLDAAATAEDELTAAAEAVTRVEALADLRIDVKDPEAPVPLGEEARYEVRVRNRGTKAAENVEVVAYFSTGIEPTGAEGLPHRMNPGQVIFQPIASLAPGSEVTLKVRARADTVGNHVFRAEVHCKPLGARLVREESTHFYQDGPQQASRTSGPLGSAVPARDVAPARSTEPQLGPPQPAEPNAPAVLPRLGEPGAAPVVR
jgi:uncharacterized repeat protein (TIGR01451 family)